jgi:hypothetical protein
MTIVVWSSVEADAKDAKADSLDLTIERLEHDCAFLELDLNGQMAQVRTTLGLLRTKRNDYRSDAERLRAS